MASRTCDVLGVRGARLLDDLDGAVRVGQRVQLRDSLQLPTRLRDGKTRVTQTYHPSLSAINFCLTQHELHGEPGGKQQLNSRSRSKLYLRLTINTTEVSKQKGNYSRVRAPAYRGNARAAELTPSAWGTEPWRCAVREKPSRRPDPGRAEPATRQVESRWKHLT